MTKTSRGRERSENRRSEEGVGHNRKFQGGGIGERKEEKKC